MDPKTTTDALAPWLDGSTWADWRARFDRDGYLIFNHVLATAEVARIRAALQPHLTKTGRNNFEGFNTNRVYALLAKAPEVFSDLVSHPLALAFAEADLGPSCLLSACLAINLQPGGSVQDWHHDDASILLPLPHPSFGVSAFWAVDAMTADNGATEVIPGSHLWSATDVPPSFRRRSTSGSPRQLDDDPAPHPDAVQVTMPPGSLMLAKGTLWHRGGANRSDANRLIVTPQYCPGWARPLETMTLAVPERIAAGLPQRTRELLGYSIHGSFMGYVDGVHPQRGLDQQPVRTTNPP